MLNYIKCNLRQIRNTETGAIERVTLLSVESDMQGYRGVTDPTSQVYELPFILHALAGTELEPVEQKGFPYSFPVTF